MSTEFGLGRWLPLTAIPVMLLALFGGIIIDATAINISNIQSMKANSLEQEQKLTTWGECRQAHISGRYLFLQGQYNDALPVLEEGALCSDNPWAWFDLGQTQYALGDHSGAIESWQRTPEGYNQAVRLAAAATQDGNEQTALAAWEFAAEVNPAEQMPYIQMSRLVASSNPERVRPLLEQAIRANPNAPEAYIELGSYLAEMGDLEEAQVHFEQALALDPANISLLITLAENTAGLGDTPAAISYWQEVALRNERRRASAYYHIGDLALNDNNLSSALAFFKQAVEINPENPQFLQGLAQTYFEMGCKQEAIVVYQDLLSEAGSDQIREEAQLKLADLAVMTNETVPCPDGP